MNTIKKLEDMKMNELRGYAKKNNIDIKGIRKKQELLNFLVNSLGNVSRKTFSVDKFSVDKFKSELHTYNNKVVKRAVLGKTRIKKFLKDFGEFLKSLDNVSRETINGDLLLETKEKALNTVELLTEINKNAPNVKSKLIKDWNKKLGRKFKSVKVQTIKVPDFEKNVTKVNKKSILDINYTLHSDTSKYNLGSCCAVAMCSKTLQLTTIYDNRVIINKRNYLTYNMLNNSFRVVNIDLPLRKFYKDDLVLTVREKLNYLLSLEEGYSLFVCEDKINTYRLLKNGIKAIKEEYRKLPFIVNFFNDILFIQRVNRSKKMVMNDKLTNRVIKREHKKIVYNMCNTTKWAMERIANSLETYYNTMHSNSFNHVKNYDFSNYGGFKTHYMSYSEIKHMDFLTNKLTPVMFSGFKIIREFKNNNRKFVKKYFDLTDYKKLVSVRNTKKITKNNDSIYKKECHMVRTVTNYHIKTSANVTENNNFIMLNTVQTDYRLKHGYKAFKEVSAMIDNPRKNKEEVAKYRKIVTLKELESNLEEYYNYFIILKDDNEIISNYNPVKWTTVFNYVNNHKYFTNKYKAKISIIKKTYELASKRVSQKVKSMTNMDSLSKSDKEKLNKLRKEINRILNILNNKNSGDTIKISGLQYLLNMSNEKLLSLNLTPSKVKKLDFKTLMA